MTDFRSAGNTTVNSLVLISYSTPERAVDIKGNFVRIAFTESMMSPFMYGYVDIGESSGMLYSSITERSSKLPHIRGEEFLFIEFIDHSNITRKEVYCVYAIDEIGLMDNKDTAMQYRLHFASIQKIFSEQYLIQKAYRNMSYSEMVRSIFQEYYIDKPKEVLDPIRGKLPEGLSSNITMFKECEIERTEERHTLIIPSLRPEEAIQFIMRKAYSETNTSSLFFFYEARDQYYFITHEQLVTRNSDLIETDYFKFKVSIGGNDSSPAGQEAAKQTISNVTFPSMNSIEAIKAQAYSRSLGELDLLNRNVQLFFYDYKEDYLGYNNVDTFPQLVNSKEFITAATGDKLNIPDNWVFKDYLTPEEGDANRPANYDRTLPRYVDVLSTKPTFSYHFEKNIINGGIPGRHFMCPGFIIKTIAPEYTKDSMTESRKEDDYFAGKQMVVTLDSMIENDTWNQRIAMTKASRGGGPLINNPGSAVGVSQISGIDEDNDGINDVTGEAITQGFTGAEAARRPSESESELRQQAMDYFVGQGYSTTEAAGIVANLAHESALNPYAINYNDAGPGKDSVGIGQWNRERSANLVAFAEARGDTEFTTVGGNRVPSFESQLAFVNQELKGTPGVTGNGAGSEGRAYRRLTSSTNATQAAVAMTSYERFRGYEAGLGNGEVRNRAATATQILQNYEGTS